MGHIENQRKSANQPKEGALDTNEDKGVNESEKTEEAQPATTEEKSEAEETEQPMELPEEKAEAEAETEEKPVAETLGAEEEETPEAEKEEITTEEAEEVAPEEELKEEKKERREELEEEEIVEERIYTIPLRRAWISPRKKRAPRAVRMVKSFIQRHMKVEIGPKETEEEEEERLVISNEVNEKLWSRGIEKPPRNIRVRAAKDKEGTVTVYLAEGD